MIDKEIIEKLTKYSYLITVEQKGIKSHIKSREGLEEEIRTALMREYDILSLYIGIDVEDYLDLRTPLDCQIFNVTMLVNFSPSEYYVKESSKKIMEYLKNNFIIHIE